MAPWQAVAQREWGTTATWIKGDGQYAVLHPCGEELTVTLCATPTEAKDAKVYRCGGRCIRSRHTVMDLSKAFGGPADRGIEGGFAAHARTSRGGSAEKRLPPLPRWPYFSASR